MQYSISLAPTAALGYFTENIDLSGANQQTEDGESDAPPAPSKVVALVVSIIFHNVPIVFPLDDDADFGLPPVGSMSAFKRSQKAILNFWESCPTKPNADVMVGSSFSLARRPKDNTCSIGSA